MNQYLPIPPDKSVPETPPEKLITIKGAADTLGLSAWKLSRAAKQGLIPTYRLLNSRRLVKLSEVLAAIEASRQGGGQ
jgi:hypothetical protein